MSVSPISTSSANPYQAELAAAFKQRGLDFKALGNALQSGDLAGAQKAFAALKTDNQTIKGAQSQSSGQNSTVSQDFTTLESALNSGDLSGAQKAFATLQQDLQAARKSHGHHVPPGPAQQGTTQNDNDADGGNRSTPSTGTTNVTA